MKKVGSIMATMCFCVMLALTIMLSGIAVVYSWSDVHLFSGIVVCSLATLYFAWRSLPIRQMVREIFKVRKAAKKVKQCNTIEITHNCIDIANDTSYDRTSLKIDVRAWE